MLIVRALNYLASTTTLSKCNLGKKYLQNVPPLLRGKCVSRHNGFSPHRVFACGTGSLASNADSESTDLHVSEDTTKERLRTLQMEYEVWLTLGNKLPSEAEMTEERWHELLELPLPQRLKKYKFWWKKEMQRSSDNIKKEGRRKVHEDRLALLQKQKDEGTWALKNTYLLFMRESTMNHWYSNNLYYAMQNGPHLLFDCSYENKMSEHALNNLCKQLKVAYAANRVYPEPFHMIFCNLKPGTKTAITLEKHLPNYDTGIYPITVTDKHYLQLFPKDRLVYLSPNSKTEMTEYHENDVYIVGAMVDRGTEEPLTFAKSKREGIRTAKFPLDKYLRWKMGGKSLTIDQVTEIMLDIRSKRDWSLAFKHVPKRKVEPY